MARTSVLRDLGRQCGPWLRERANESRCGAEHVLYDHPPAAVPVRRRCASSAG